MDKKLVHSFEDLEVYKLAREFSGRVNELVKMLPKEEDHNLKNQMRRAKLSVTNNVAEGFGRYHYQENIQFCRQSRGSICELTLLLHKDPVELPQCPYKEPVYSLLMIPFKSTFRVI